MNLIFFGLEVLQDYFSPHPSHIMTQNSEVYNF